MVQEKEQEMVQFRAAHKNPNDDLQMMLSYMDTKGDGSVAKKLTDSLRRGRPHGLSVGIDLKRRSPTNPSFRCDFSDPGAVASAFLDSDADFVFANCDFSSYGGELNDIKQIVSATRASSPSSAVIFKDIIIDPLQLALAKQLQCDAALVLACVVGSELPSLLDTATLINLPIVVECHTEEEVKIAVENGAGTILLNRVDRFSGNKLYPDQPFAIQDALPPGNFVTTLVTGKVTDTESAQKFLDAGFDGVVIGSALIGNPSADKFIKSVKDLEMGEDAKIMNSIG
ncbi:hypothetical protein TrCOL_g3723 [Triparma columacea]|uniref:indole-3-glycerol-phosphate synthase n=1 Tax=Triparma columacea TaxID=722753 RepID=A0A9W7L990_9STRA|nr:hypothetical protein TrCOL_g3723 [Triparma columacea]